MDIRLIILIISGITALYSFITIYIESQKSIRESDRIKRDAVVIYTGNEKSKELIYKYKKIEIAARPQYLYETRSGDLIIVERVENLKKIDVDYYKYKIGAEFLAVESEYKRMPVYAVIEDIKTGRHVIIENSLELRSETLEIAAEMGDIMGNDARAERNHNAKDRCEGCLYKVDCPDRL